MRAGELGLEVGGLTGAQKVAVGLMQMSPGSAASVMTQFSESEAEDVAAEIVRLRRVSSSVADHVMTEFHDLAVSGRRTARGGQEFAVGLLEASFGADKAAGFMDRLASTMAGKSFEFLEMMDPGQLLALIDGERRRAQIEAMVAENPARTAEYLRGLMDERQPV